MWAREPGQVRKEAALSGSRHVMQASLARAKYGGHAREPRFDGGCTVHFLFAGFYGCATGGLTADNFRVGRESE